MSRIDFILLEMAFCPRLLSDHSPHWITLSIPINKPPRTWSLNPFWFSLLPEDEEITNEWKAYFAQYDHSPPLAVWDSFKLYARTSLILHINKIKADPAGAFEKAVTELSSTKQEYVTDPSPAKANLFKLQTRVVTQLQFEKIRRKQFFTKQKLFKHGEKAGKLLAYLVHTEDRPPVVISLHGPAGQQITDPPRVTSMFRDFFADLYTSTVLLT